MCAPVGIESFIMLENPIEIAPDCIVGSRRPAAALEALP